MFIFFPPALVTCLIFLAFYAIMDLAIIAVIYIVTRFDLFHGFIGFGPLFNWVVFGALWCLSFYLAPGVQHVIRRSRRTLTIEPYAANYVDS